MLKREISIGKTYVAKISNSLTTVILLRESPYGGWIARNTNSGREVRIKSAAKLRAEVR